MQMKRIILYFNLYIPLKTLKIDLTRLEVLMLNKPHVHLRTLARVGYVELNFKALMQG